MELASGTENGIKGMFSEDAVFSGKSIAKSLHGLIVFDCTLRDNKSAQFGIAALFVDNNVTKPERP